MDAFLDVQCAKNRHDVTCCRDPALPALVRYYYLHKFGHVADKLLPIPNELDQELKWAQGRPQSQAASWEPLSMTSDDEPFLSALTCSEERYRLSYAAEHPQQAWQLNQNPDAGFGATSKDHKLPTLIGNVHMLFTEHPDVRPSRWLVGSEALATQAFPVVPYLFGIPPDQFPPLCTFNVAREGRTSRQLLVQAGNAMNTMVITAICLHGLCDWKRAEIPSLMSNIRLSRSLTLASMRAKTFDEEPPAKRRYKGKQPQDML